MGKTNIEWTQKPDWSPGFTWNPLAGCSVLTPGCSSCYAMKLAPRLARMGQPLYEGLTKETKGGAVWTGEIRRAAESVLTAPLRRHKPTTYFVNSMSDLFHEAVPDEWVLDILDVIRRTSHDGGSNIGKIKGAGEHTYQLLTKRAARMQRFMQRLRFDPHKGLYLGDSGPPVVMKNLWLGVSTEDQKRADERIPLLLQTPAAIRFISAEPLLGPINLTRLTREGINAAFIDNALDGFVSNGHGGTIGPKLDWVIVGGESGHGFRKMDPAWAESILAQCKSAGTAVFMKQMSGRAPIPLLMQIRQFPETLTR